MPAPVASGGANRRVGLAPTGKAPPCHGARGERSFAASHQSDGVAPIPAVQLFSDSRGICLVRAADGHHCRRPRIACRRLTLITRERAFFLQVCELAHTSQKFICILSTASGSAKKFRQ